MLGHIAQSVGGALPATSSANPLISQVAVFRPGSSSVIPPEDGFAYIEGIGQGGGNSGTGSTGRGGGAAGGDAIIPVTSGAAISFNLPNANYANNPGNLSVSYAGQTVLTAGSAPRNATTGNGAASTAGKYPGGIGTSAASGKGGGRLSGNVPTSADQAPGYGNGAFDTNVNGGNSFGMVTFFRTYDAALAFANSLYGGNWQP